MYSENEKPSVTVIAYSNNDLKKNIVNSCLNEIQDVLIKSERFIVVEKEQRDVLLIDEEFGDISNCNFKCALDIGKSLGLDYIITIEINKSNKAYILNLDFISIKKENKEIIKRPTDHLSQFSQIDSHENLLTIIYEYGNIIIEFLNEEENQPNHSDYNSNRFDQSINNTQNNFQISYTPTVNSSNDDPNPPDLATTFCCFWLGYIPYLVILGLIPAA